MPRIVVNIDPEEKRWLGREARRDAFPWRNWFARLCGCIVLVPKRV